MRSKWLKIRISPEETARIKQKMQQTGIRNMSAYVRKMVLDGYCVTVEIGDLHEVIRLLSTCGGYLERISTASDTITHEEIRKLRLQLDAVWKELKRLLEAVASIR